MVTAMSLISQKSKVTLGTRLNRIGVSSAGGDSFALYSPMSKVMSVASLFAGELERVGEESVGALVVIGVAAFGALGLKISDCLHVRVAELGCLQGIPEGLQHVFARHRRSRCEWHETGGHDGGN